MNLLRKIKYHPFFIRLLNWEYWPFAVVYTPIYPIWLWYCLKARSFFFFGASNPSIQNAGFLMESKKEIYDLIPEDYKPLTLFFANGTDTDLVIAGIRNQNLQYPLIIKPDIGMQGKAVLKVHDDKELIEATEKFTVDYIVQPFIPYEKEVGIFYVRHPNEIYGKITGIVEKEFLTITGDGISTIEELLLKSPRYILQIPYLKKTMGAKIYSIPEKNYKEVLVPYGNHVRGSLFLDSTFKNNSQLESVIDNVCSKVKDFYYGRLDIRFNSFEEMQENKNWCIIELNGAGSEPTHMYDPSHSLFFAWKEIIRHWKLLYEISIMNKKRGFRYLSFKDGVKMFRSNSKYVKEIDSIDFNKQKKYPASIIRMTNSMEIARSAK